MSTTTREPGQHFTKELRAGQRAFSFFVDLLAEHSEDNVRNCREATRTMLECVRGGTATEEEAAAIRRGVKHLNKHSRREEDKRHLYVLTMRYLAPEPMTVGELAFSLCLDKSTVHRDIRAAIEKLSVLLFGVYATDWR